MKLNININSIKKGLFLVGLSLMCVSVSGCVEKEQDTNISTVTDQKDDDNKLKVTEAPETLEVLDAYNSMLEQLEKCHDYEIKNKRLDVNDLEWMSQFNEGIFSIKSNDGELLQINGEDYRFVNLDEKNSDSLRIIFSSDYDHFEEFHSPSSVQVGEYINDNNTEIDAYTFPVSICWSDEAREEITKKYGEDIFSCVQQYGIPVAMYSYESFNAKDVKLEHSKEKTK